MAKKNVATVLELIRSKYASLPVIEASKQQGKKPIATVIQELSIRFGRLIGVHPTCFCSLPPFCLSSFVSFAGKPYHAHA